MGGGVLSGKYRAQGVEGRLNRAASNLPAKDQERADRILGAVEEIAAATGAKPSQIAIAWARARSQGRAPLIPIIGARTLAQLNENLGALAIDLTGEHMRRLNEASAIELGFPHDLIASDVLRGLGFSNRWDRIDKPATTIA
jgi:aryl-alcohol dehydrogenase-like predicted oxidoreductase